MYALRSRGSDRRQRLARDGAIFQRGDERRVSRRWTTRRIICLVLLVTAVGWMGYMIQPIRLGQGPGSDQSPRDTSPEWINESKEGTRHSPTVAFVISFTSLGGPGASTLLDAAEVLLDSIRRTSSASEYAYETIAFVMPEVSFEGRKQIAQIGWKVMEKDHPVSVEDIENTRYRTHVINSGCCGVSEFIKLHAYTLTDYHRVLHLDIDTMVLEPMDELMGLNASLVFTTDPAMATRGQNAMPTQGGFLLVKPDLRVYRKMQDIVRQGNWKVNVGWGGSKIGYFYGGSTIQGLLPYYYNVVEPGTAQEVDRCMYNHMSDSETCTSGTYIVRQTGGVMRGQSSRVSSEHRVGDKGQDALPIKSVHFTQSCPKPWMCAASQQKIAANNGKGPCASLSEAWYEGRRRALLRRGLPLSPACVRNQYSPVWKFEE